MNKQRIQKKNHVTNNQFGFMLGRWTMEEIYLLRRELERYQMDQQGLPLVFIDLMKEMINSQKKFIRKQQIKGLKLSLFKLSRLCMREGDLDQCFHKYWKDFHYNMIALGFKPNTYFYTLVLNIFMKHIQ